MQRREFLRAGLAGFGGLTLPGLFRLRALANRPATPERTAVILVWMRGGCSHLDTYDPKPDAPSEYRGPFAPIATRTPGLHITELLPRHARVAHRFSLLRSVAHTGGGHPAGSLQMLSGDPDAPDKLRPVYPDFMSVANYLHSDPGRPLPNYVGVNPIVNYDNFTIAGPAYVGEGYGPFAVTGDASAPGFRVPNVGIADARVLETLRTRLSLQKQLDTIRRDLDRSGTMQAMDRFEAQAVNLLTSRAAATAFDLSREDPRVRERYGLNQWGQQLLMARRLVEAGVEIITSTFDGPLCGRVGNWDDHAVNHNVFEGMKYRTPVFDQAVSTLISDLHERGLDKRVLLIVTGEFGRTPKISYVASTGAGAASAPAGTVQPGRDHWPSATSLLFSGGGIAEGEIIGATDSRGEQAIERRVGVQDFLATVYRHLGVDAERVAFNNFSGRPIPILADGKPIRELLPHG
jgi:uncharacterized protein (DUF1501 family)